jgi:uncharacterized protein with HEPN domain
MSRDADLLLGEILEAIELIQRYTDGLSYADFAGDVEKQDAVIRRLEIIGEAVKGLPVELLEKYPDTPWRDIAGARDVMIHEYFRVDLELAWEMVQDDIGPLAVAVRRILKEHFPNDETAV